MRILSVKVFLILFCMITTFSASIATESDTANIVVRGKGVWDATGNAVIPDGVIVIQGDQITAVGTEKQISMPIGATVLDHRDLFLMPGLVNSHEHYSLDQFAGQDEAGIFAMPNPYLALRAAMNGRNSLRSGVTTARVPGDKDFLDIQYKRAFAEGVVPGPRMIVAGRFIRPPDGFPTYTTLGPAPSGVEEVRRFVRENIRAGADFCKMFISGTGVDVGDGSNVEDNSVIDAIYFSKEEIETVVEECHRHGKKVTAHVHKDGPSFQWALEAGVDVFEHGLFLTEKNMRQLKKHGRYLVIGGTRWLVPGGEYAGIPAPPGGATLIRNWYETALKIRPPLAVGVDGFHEPGAMAKEVGRLVQYGFTNEEALLMATRNGGELAGLPVGTLTPGNYADIIGVRGNPLDDISVLQQVEFVMKGGREYVLSEK